MQHDDGARQPVSQCCARIKKIYICKRKIYAEWNSMFNVIWEQGGGAWISI